MSKNKIYNSILVIFTFLFAVYGKRTIGKWIPVSTDSHLLKILYFYAWWLVPICILIGLLYSYKNIVAELCLNKNIFLGASFSLIVVAPMLISSSLIGTIDENLNWISLIHKTVFAGFMEEVLFRGFLFGILFRKLNWGFIPASILGAVIFALGHIYQGSSAGEMIGIFCITFIGSAWFAWLFIEWNENLWIPIFLHILMNLSWTLFNVSDNALGGVYTNIFRIVTIALTVLITIYLNNKKGNMQLLAKIYL